MEQLCNIVTHTQSERLVQVPRQIRQNDTVLVDKQTKMFYIFYKTLLRRNRSLLPYQPICLALQRSET